MSLHIGAELLSAAPFGIRPTDRPGEYTLRLTKALLSYRQHVPHCLLCEVQH